MDKDDNSNNGSDKFNELKIPEDSKQKRKKINLSSSVIIKFSTVFLGIIAVFSIFLTVYFVSGLGRGAEVEVAQKLPLFVDENNDGVNDINYRTPPPNEDLGFLKPPLRTNVLILGVDNIGGLSDVNLVASFNSSTKEIDFISLPRDSKITISKDEVNAIKELGRYCPSSGTMKLTELYSYAGKAKGHEFQKRYIQSLLGISIDYYAVIDLDAFKNIVKAVGGIYMDIPAGGLHYNDPEQKLKISVPGGRVLLDGDMAEGVVRFRNTYANGDLQRIEVQKKFMKEFFSQVLKKESIMNNLTSLISTFINYVSTDFPITDIPKYLSSISQLDSEKMTFYTMPGEGVNLPEGSYFIVDAKETKKLVNDIFYSDPPEEEVTPSQTPSAPLPSNSKGLKIQVLNGGDTNGMAATVRDKLKTAGFNITKADNYSGKKVDETRIVVSREGMGEDLVKHFKNAVIEVDPDVGDGGLTCDILIIVGKSE